MVAGVVEDVLVEGGGGGGGGGGAGGRSISAGEGWRGGEGAGVREYGIVRGGGVCDGDCGCLGGDSGVML